MTTFKWLNEATKKIHFGPDREAVRRELEEHLLDRQERYLARGMAEDEAAKAAVADMGDPETLAVELGRIHSPWWGWLWQASRALLALAAAVFLMTYLITQTGFGDWPGQRLYEYITWEGSSHFTGEALLERRQYAPERTGKAGAYTLKAEGITLDTVVKAAPFRVLYIDMTITRPLWAQPCAFSDAIHTVSDSTESPRNSNRSLDAIRAPLCSLTKEVCVRAVSKSEML